MEIVIASVGSDAYNTSVKKERMNSKEKEPEHILHLIEEYDFEKRYKNLLTQIQDVLEGLGILDKV